MSDNTYRSNHKSIQMKGRGLFSWIEKFLKLDSTISEVVHIKYFPQILFLTCLCLIYISNRHIADGKVRDIAKLEREVNQLKADYTMLQANYMLATKQSEIAQSAKALGLKPPKESPLKIILQDQ